MIYFDEQRQVFHLQGHRFSYQMKIVDGVLMHMYWGRRLPSCDGDCLFTLPGEAASFDLPFNRRPREVPTQEKGYFGRRALDIVNAQGDDVLSLRYESHTIFTGKKALPGLPSSYTDEDNACQTLEITLTDAFLHLDVVLSYTVFEDADVLARSMRIINNSQDTVTLKDLQTAVCLPYDKYDMIHLKGGWARERQAMRTPLPMGLTTIQSRRGASGHENNPFLALVKPETTEFSGEVYAMTHVYSGSFSACADVGMDLAPTMMMGFCPDVFSWQLNPGETFQGPEALLMYTRDGLNGLSAISHPFIRRHICRGYWRDRPRPVLINNWEATYFDFNAVKLYDIAKKGAEIGCELFVLDDGWFGRRNTDNCSLGDWVVNEQKIKGGLKKLAERIESLGMMCGLWFEPEMVSPDSDLYRAHPDWCLHVPGRERTQARQQLILDLSRKEVQDYIIESISAVLRSAPISYVKWDMNRNMTEGFSAALPREQKMESQHRYMLGLYRVLGEITSRFPRVLFESCSGGGGRFDCGILSFMPQTWTSDDTDAAERIKIQYGTSILYPCSSMGAHVSAVPNHQTSRTTPFLTRCHVAMGGNFGFELDLNKLSGEDLQCAREAVAMVKELRTTMQQGTYARLSNPMTSGGSAAWQFTDDERLIVCIYHHQATANQPPQSIRLTGLQEDAVYRDDEHNITCSGAALMGMGLPLPYMRGDFKTLLCCFRKIS